MESIKKFVEQLGVQRQGVSFPSPEKVILCDACLSEVVKAVEWKEKFDVEEEDVRDLHRIILNKMRQLNNFKGNYLEKMKRLEEKIKRSEDTVVGTCEEDAFRLGIRSGVVDFQTANVFSNTPSSYQTRSRPLESVNARAEFFPFQDFLLTENNGNIGNSDMDQEVIFQSENLISSLLGDLSVKESAEHNNFGLVSMTPGNVEQMLEKDHTTEDFVPKHNNEIEHNVNWEGNGPKKTSPVASRSKSKGNKDSNICQVCGKKFQRRKDLKIHGYTHAGERPFKCHLCPATFRHKLNFDRHLMSHKPFHCSQCGKGFTTKWYLDGHKKTHTGNNPFQCLLCGLGYSCKQSLKSHIKRKHPANPDTAA